MCASTSLKTLRINIPHLNKTEACNKNNTVSNDVNISLLWLDKNTCLQDDEDVCETKRMLKEINNNATFHSDFDGLIKFLEDNLNDTFFLVISGVEATSTTIFQKLHSLKHIDSIFLFCLEKQTYEPLLTDQHPSKIVGIFNTQSELCNSIRKTLDHVRRHFAAFTLFNQKQHSMRNLSIDSIRFLWHQLLKDTLWKISRTDDWKIRMIEKFRDYYRGSANELKDVGEFETQYKSSDAVKWYTKDMFIYKLINQALRTEDIDALYTLRYYIEDLCLDLKNRYEQFRQLHIELEMPSVTLYRGLRLDRDQILKLKMNVKNLISTNGFLSATRSLDVAKFYAGWDEPCQSTTDITEPVLFIINIDVNEDKIIVADIAADSMMPDELEVLFDLGSIFEINSITEDDTQKPSKWTLSMTASNNGEKILNDYILFKRQDMEGFDISIIFGEFLYDMGEYQKAEKYFENLLLTEDTPQRRYSLGMVHCLKGEYDQALYHLQSAYNRYREILLPMASVSQVLFDTDAAQNMLNEMARVSVAIANIHFDTNNPDEALIHYKNALHAYETSIPDSNSPQIGNCLQNIGLIYQQHGSYNEALEKFYQATDIFSKTLPENHPDRAGLLLNIGNIYRLQNQYDLAIESYTSALDMLKKIYPSKHRLITECMNNIGLLHMSKHQYDESLKWFLQCLENYNEFESSNTQNILYVHIHANIAESYEKTDNICDAIRYYEQSLTNFEKAQQDGWRIVKYVNSNDAEETKETEEKSLTDLFSILENFKELYSGEHPHVPSVLRDIGKAFFNDKKYKDALKYYNQSLEMCTKFQSFEHLDAAACLTDISSIYQIEGDYLKALDYAAESYNVLSKILSSKHPKIKSILEHIIHLCNETGESVKASLYSAKLRLSCEKEITSDDFDSDGIRKKMFYLYYKQEKYQEALNIVSSKIAIFEDQQSQTILGQIHLKLGQYEQAAFHSRNALTLSSNDSNIVICNTQLGHAYLLQHDKTNALMCYEKCVEILRRDTSDEDELANVLINMGAIYLDQSSYNDSLLHYSEALKIKKKTDPSNNTLVGAITSCIGKSLFKQHNYDEALVHFIEAFEILKQSEDSIELATIHEFIGIIYYEKPDLEISLKHLLIALELYDKLKSTENDSKLENILGTIANVFYDKQDFQAALSYYKKSLIIADNNDSPNLVSTLYQISQVYFQLNNMNYGIEYIKRCIEVQEALVDDENDQDLMSFKQVLSYTQLLNSTRKQKRRRKYKRLFHKKRYQRRMKKKSVIMVPPELGNLITEFCEQSQTV
ncbi:unnamed protein product [Rotaria magnacalcarata]|uniref:Nephrocystin-3 n=4 Tax=Rotaria magnacalcarata TaxID=392030 RepID=A0A814IMQ8_9BILA|nr:unnamed protein product [Rotaria magnacalcarata]CAF3918420.1 unnamed protein product [Rotaria magnacalcarata]